MAEIEAHITGTVWKIEVSPGDSVDEGDTDRFQLTRFVITCCVADATISCVTVVDAPPGQVANDDWVRVTGTIYPLGSDILVDVETVVPIPPPDDPYLTP